MWRNPLTNRFEAGDPPNQNQPAPGAPTAPTEQRGGRYDGGWDYIAQPGGDSDGKGGEVHSADDVLTIGQGFADKQVLPYKPTPPAGVPKG